MRVLFSSVPVPGHLLPLVPLAQAAAEAGHTTAMITHGDLAPLVAPLRVLPVGPTVREAFEEAARRVGPTSGGIDDVTVELFAGVRVELTAEAALRRGEAFAPDVLVCERTDHVGPLVAASLGVPWVVVELTGPLPAWLVPAMERRAGVELAARGLRRTAPAATVDPYPSVLLLEGERADEDRVQVRPTPHGGLRTDEVTPPPGRRPRALVTLGSTVITPGVTEALASSVSVAGFDVTVTVPRWDGVAGPGEIGTIDRPPGAGTVVPVGFTPLAALLPGVDLVVTAGGTGTVLGTLAAGLPVVVVPHVADQWLNADRVAAAGVGERVDEPAAAGAAARRVVDGPGPRRAARRMARSIASMPSPSWALEQALERARQQGRTSAA